MYRLCPHISTHALVDMFNCLAYVPDLSLPNPETDGYSQEEEGTIARQGG